MPASTAKRQLLVALADAGEHDLFRRDAGGQRLAGSRPRIRYRRRRRAGERLEHGEIAVRLHGVEDMRALATDRLGEQAVVPLDRRRRIAVERRADLGGEPREVDALGVEHAVGVGEVKHKGLALGPAVPRQRIRPSRMKPLCGFGAASSDLPCPEFGGCAGLVLRFGLGRQFQRTLQATAGQQQGCCRDRHLKFHRVSNEPSFRAFAREVSSTLSPPDRHFPTALSSDPPFRRRSVARFRHSWSGSSPNSPTLSTSKTRRGDARLDGLHVGERQRVELDALLLRQPRRSGR